jgi:hypothetical protein
MLQRFRFFFNLFSFIGGKDKYKILNVECIKQLTIEFLFNKGLVHAKKVIVNALHQYAIDCLLILGEGSLNLVVADLIIVHDFLSKCVFMFFSLILCAFKSTDILI